LDHVDEDSQPYKLAPGIARLRLPLGTSYLKTVNAYLVEDAHGATLIDCGVANDETWEAFTYQLDVLGVPLQHVSRILITHAHGDHSGLAARIKAANGATVWAHSTMRPAPPVSSLQSSYITAANISRSGHTISSSNGPQAILRATFALWTKGTP
jgi:glyoxylase-like metal-dependent hydrolase (beta-lactamase superfamily II)